MSIAYQDSVDDLRKEVHSLRNDLADMISAQIQVALKKEYDRGWSACMEYYWSKREMDEDRIEKEFSGKDGEKVSKA
jgi:regulator of replication initiation timing